MKLCGSMHEPKADHFVVIAIKIIDISPVLTIGVAEW